MKKVVHYFFVVSILLLCSCSNNTSLDKKVDNTVENQVKYSNKVYTLTKGLVEQFRFRSNDSHSGGQINMTDGEFFQTQINILGTIHIVWRANNASVWLYTKMYSPGAGGLANGTYIFMPTGTDESDITLADTFFFEKGKFGVDLNDDGEIESDDGEFLEIIGGTIELKVSGDEYTVEFNLNLRNDTNVSGKFSNNFTQVPAV